MSDARSLRDHYPLLGTLKVLLIPVGITVGLAIGVPFMNVQFAASAPDSQVMWAIMAASVFMTVVILAAMAGFNYCFMPVRAPYDAYAVVNGNEVVPPGATKRFFSVFDMPLESVLVCRKYEHDIAFVDRGREYLLRFISTVHITDATVAREGNAHFDQMWREWIEKRVVASARDVVEHGWAERGDGNYLAHLAVSVNDQNAREQGKGFGAWPVNIQAFEVRVSLPFCRDASRRSGHEES